MLAAMHARLRPRTYFEIGVFRGASLTRTIAVDPAYSIIHPIRCNLAAFREGSDDFFGPADGFEHFGGTP